MMCRQHKANFAYFYFYFTPSVRRLLHASQGVEASIG
jgi:hypothetical protein